MTPRRVLVTQNYFDDATIEYLQANGCTVEIAELPKGEADRNLTEEHLLGLLEGIEGWIVGHARVTRTLLAARPDLKIISRRGVGYERVDIEAVRELGRVVTIAAGGNDASVADHTLGLMLAVARRLRESHDQMRAGDWTIRVSSDLYQKTVGVVGLGRIGRSVIQRLSGFETRTLVYDPYPDQAYGERHGVVFTDVATILRESDYITLHAPLLSETRNLVNAETIATMKPGAIVINAARGGLVDDRALLDALESGHLGGAGLDVFLSENDLDYKPVTERLLALPNVVATPHAAASSREGLARTNMVAAQSVVAVLNGDMPEKACIVADGRVPSPS